MQQVRTEIRTADWHHFDSTPDLPWRTIHHDHDRFSTAQPIQPTRPRILDSIGRPIFINYLVLLFSLPWIWSRLIASSFIPLSRIATTVFFNERLTTTRITTAHEHLILLSMLLSWGWWSWERKEKESVELASYGAVCFACVFISKCVVWFHAMQVHKIWTWI